MHKTKTLEKNDSMRKREFKWIPLGMVIAAAALAQMADVAGTPRPPSQLSFGNLPCNDMPCEASHCTEACT